MKISRSSRRLKLLMSSWANLCAVRNAFGLGLSVTCGVVSALHRTDTGFNDVEDFLQTDAAVNPGMSGGALVDEDGRLVGLLSAIFASGADTNAGVNLPSPPRFCTGSRST